MAEYKKQFSVGLVNVGITPKGGVQLAFDNKSSWFKPSDIKFIARMIRAGLNAEHLDKVCLELEDVQQANKDTKHIDNQATKAAVLLASLDEKALERIQALLMQKKAQ